MTLSLLKNKEEFDNLRIPAHTYAKHDYHPDMDWIRVQQSNYSKKFTDCDPEFDEMIVKCGCIFFRSCKSKSNLLKIICLYDALMYFDNDFYQISQNETDMKEFFDKLENVLIKSKPVQGFALGMRFKQSMDEIMADMTERQSKDLKKAINDYFCAQKYVHYELGLNGKFIPIKDYFEVRGREGAIFIFCLLLEYELELSLTEEIVGKLEIKQFIEQINRYALSLCETFDFKSKLVRNDISSHIISYSASNRCSLQEAVDMNDMVIENSKLRAIKSQKSIMKNDLLNSSEVEQFINALFDFVDNMLQFYYECSGNEIKEGLVYHKKWENMLN